MRSPGDIANSIFGGKGCHCDSSKGERTGAYNSCRYCTAVTLISNEKADLLSRIDLLRIACWVLMNQRNYARGAADGIRAEFVDGVCYDWKESEARFTEEQGIDMEKPDRMAPGLVDDLLKQLLLDGALDR